MDQLTMAGWEIHLDEGGNGTLHTLRGASGQVDILRLGWIAVTLELGEYGIVKNKMKPMKKKNVLIIA